MVLVRLSTLFVLFFSQSAFYGVTKTCEGNSSTVKPNNKQKEKQTETNSAEFLLGGLGLEPLTSRIRGVWYQREVGHHLEPRTRDVVATSHSAAGVRQLHPSAAIHNTSAHNQNSSTLA